MSKIYTIEEVAKHSKKGDLWLTVHGQVFDVSKWMNDHPGGEEILLGYKDAKDATVEFEQVKHSDDARKLAATFKIGVLPGMTDAPLPKMSQGISTYNPADKKRVDVTDQGDSSGTIMAVVAVGAIAVGVYLYMKSKTT